MLAVTTIGSFFLLQFGHVFDLGHQALTEGLDALHAWVRLLHLLFVHAVHLIDLVLQELYFEVLFHGLHLSRLPLFPQPLLQLRVLLLQLFVLAVFHENLVLELSELFVHGVDILLSYGSLLGGQLLSERHLTL